MSKKSKVNLREFWKKPLVFIDIKENGDFDVFADQGVAVMSRCTHKTENETFCEFAEPIPDDWLVVDLETDNSVATMNAKAEGNDDPQPSTESAVNRAQ